MEAWAGEPHCPPPLSQGCDGFSCQNASHLQPGLAARTQVFESPQCAVEPPPLSPLLLPFPAFAKWGGRERWGEASGGEGSDGVDLAT